jgi:hypothetical protein
MVLMGFQWVRPSVELHFWPDWHLLALLSRCLQYTVRIIASETQERRNPGNSRENTDGLFCLVAILFGIKLYSFFREGIATNLACYYIYLNNRGQEFKKI